MVVPFASPTTPQAPHWEATRRDGAILAPWRRFSLLIWNNQTASLVPCPGARLTPSRTWLLMK